MSGAVLLVGDDPIVARKLGAALNRDIQMSGSVQEHSESPSAVVVDLDRPDALETAGVVRLRWPACLLAGYISMPDRTRWEEAAQFFDLVATRGAIASRLATELPTWTGPRAVFRIRLFEAADAVGRLGVVHRAKTPAGPIAVYSIGRQLYAVADICPHAGGTLSDGTLSGSTITCPLHGSQFDVRDGTRTRGPSDENITAHRIVVEDGIVYLELDPEPG